ncbi:hypothetical protein DUI87_17328 [Hirundo rustica rustica]|uniref:Arginine/serine-rich coiled-coil protein 2 n=1 Tax=Hirundo rustica rustica TaxID=333673 RepID=A0A3M0JY94_HIRRU|nr:hypothetical protein DUI87_17328 [Hirundo rustica rustica]
MMGSGRDGRAAPTASISVSRSFCSVPRGLERGEDSLGLSPGGSMALGRSAVVILAFLMGTVGRSLDIPKEENTEAGAEAKRTNFFLKQARRHESKEKSSKKHKSEDHNDKEHSSDKGRDSLNSSENGEERHKRKERKSSRGRSHSRSRSRERLERAKKLQEQREKEMVEKQKQQEMAAAAAATGGSVINVAALLASGTQVTPQIAMAAQMAALQAKALAETGIAVPSYYNPAAVNPMKFAEQEKKRKMLWQGKKEGVTLAFLTFMNLFGNVFAQFKDADECYFQLSYLLDKSQSAEIWEKLNFGNKDQNVKFRKLMGIKSEDEAGCSSVDEESYKTLKQQEEVFRNLDAQYEMARSQTHTQRGMGLGFTSSMRGMDAV